MKVEIFKNIIENYVPKKMHNLAYFPAYLLRQKLSKHDVINIEQLRKKNTRCIIAGTGPSINQVDTSRYEGYDVLSISNFFLHSDIGQIDPLFQFFAPYHLPMLLDNYVAWLHDSDSILSDKCIIVLGSSVKSIVESNNIFPNKKVIYLDMSPFKPKRINIKKPILSPQTGPLMALPVALALGYEEVNLVGCDHNVLKNFKGKVEHFYSPDLEVRKNTNGTGWWPSIINELHCNLRVFESYEYYRKINKQSIIINRSETSWLDMFEYKEW